MTNIGGSFATRATVADTYTLPVGTHQISTDGFFVSTAVTSGFTRLQVAVRGAGGQDFGTCFTGTASALAQREATCSTTRVATVTQPTPVTVWVFGYADNQGSADGGLFTAYTASRHSKSAEGRATGVCARPLQPSAGPSRRDEVVLPILARNDASSGWEMPWHASNAAGGAATVNGTIGGLHGPPLQIRKALTV